MPTISYDPKNKVERASDFPRLKLELNERKRILCLEDPTYAWVHTLRAPKIVNGKAEMILKERKDKTTYYDFDLDFIGRPLCLGDLGVLEDKALDVKNCPMCAKASQGDHVDPPQRRFAMNVISYNLKQGDFEPALPFGCSVVVWSFTDQIFGQLVDFASDWPLREHDLKLGPCTNKAFQKYEIKISKDAAWMGDETRKRIVTETYRENRVEDLEAACGRKAELRWIELDLENIAERWRLANGPGKPDGTERAEAQSLTEGLDGLMDSVKPASGEPIDLGDLLSTGQASTGGGSAAGVDFTDLFGGGAEDQTEAKPTSTEPKPAAAAQAMDFDALLGGLS